MYLNSSSLLLLGGSLLSYYLIHSFPQFYSQSLLNLWKSVINDVLNAIINIRLRSIPFLNVLLIWMQSVCNVYRIQTDYVLFNVTQSRYLSEHYITISLLLSTPQYNYQGTITKLDLYSFSCYCSLKSNNTSSLILCQLLTQTVHTLGIE